MWYTLVRNIKMPCKLYLSYSIASYNTSSTFSHPLLKRNIELQSSEEGNADKQFISA